MEEGQGAKRCNGAQDRTYLQVLSTLRSELTENDTNASEQRGEMGSYARGPLFWNNE